MSTGVSGRIPRKVWGGTGLLVLGRVWGSACTLSYLALAARYLGEEGFGRFTYYLAVFLVLDSLVDLGTGQAAIQLSAADDSRVNGVIAAARRVRLVTGLVGVVLVGGGALGAGEPGAVWVLIASFYPVTHVLELSTLVLRNRIAWARPVAVRSIASGLSLGFVALLLLAGSREAAHYLCAVAAGSTIGNVLLHLVGRRHLPPRGGPSVGVRQLVSLALPMGIAGVCQQAYFWIDNLFVRVWNGDAWLGRYNLAVRVMSFGIMAGTYASLAALPWLTREHRAGRLGPAVVSLAQPTFALAGLGAGLLWPFGGDLLVLLGGQEHFRGAAPALGWLLLATATVYVGAPLLTGVVASGRSRSVLVVAVFALGVNVAGNTWLVPSMGIEGAAIATLVTEAVVALGAAISLWRAGASLNRRPLAWTAGPLLFILGRVLSGWLAS